MRTFARVSALVALVVAASACDPGPQSTGTGSAPDPPAPAAPVAAANGQPSSRVIGERIGSIELPRGMRLQFVEFATNTHGYAHYISDAPESGGYRSLLFATRDGGRTWIGASVPLAVSPDPQLYVIDATTVLMTGAADDWYVSTDAGQTFRLERHAGSMPAGYYGLGFHGEYGIDCPNDSCQVMVRAGAVARPTATQPDLPGRITAAVGSGQRVFAAALSAERTRTRR